ncbi:hypothetical protein BGW41_006656 [Actinomortierella wolfii]|nr:hypothetical protein BGW41_006656 [Actinomortierella wolfii]
MTRYGSMLTVSQEHYLKKYLLGVLINKELDLLQKQPYETLPHLGGPFDMLDEYKASITPFLRYLFESIVVPFPFLTTTNGSLWSKLQTFMEEWAKLEAGNGIEREEMLRRKSLKNKGERTIVLMYSMAVKTMQQREKEKTDRLARQPILNLDTISERVQDDNVAVQPSHGHNNNSQSFPTNSLHPEDARGRTMDKGGSLSSRSSLSAHAPSRSPSPGIPTSLIHGVRINIVGVRIVRVKHHVREHEHALKHEFPQYEFNLPPEKHGGSSGSNTPRIGREKDRIMLRGYLHHLARVAPEVIASDTFRSFLTKDAISLSEEEMRDIEVRTALDEHRMQEQAKFDSEVAKKVEEIESRLQEVKQDLLQPGGISRLFEAFRTVERVEDLPQLYQVVFEWGCMSFASTLHHLFTSSDDASINFAQLKRTHSLLPYRTMWGILKISNPMAMMKGLMELFLAQPFGSKSLLQRIIAGSMYEEISEYKKDIAGLERAIDDISLCEKIRNYVYATNSVISQVLSTDEPYDITDINLVMDVLRSDKILPVLTPMQIDALWSAKQELEQEQEKSMLDGKVASRSGVDSSETSESEDSGSGSSMEGYDSISSRSEPQQPSSERKNLIRQLQRLLVAHLRIRDKERMINLVFQGVTAEILKELITIFYQPLVKVYKSANVADSLFDVKDFADELIKIVEEADANNEGIPGVGNDRPTTASLYLNLVRKHLPSFYKFVHSVHKQDDGLFHDLLEWIESIINFMRTGYSRLIPDYATGEERRVTIDMDMFIKTTIPQDKWDQLQEEAEALRKYFSEVKERKKETVRHMAGLDKATLYSPQHGRSPSPASNRTLDNFEQDMNLKGQDRVSEELRGLGIQQEDVDELEMINYESFHIGGGDGDLTHSGEQGLKVPKVPLIDTLRQPFVELMDRSLFQSARG